MARTTIRLPEDLLREAKKHAAERGTSLTRLVEEALRATLSRARQGEESREPVSLTTVDGSGVQPGVDLDDTAALLDLMESADAAS